MKTFLITLLAIILSPNPIYPALSQNTKLYKWQPIGSAFLINTEDFKIQKNILTFFILRKSIPTDIVEKRLLKNQYLAALNVNCDQFTYSIQDIYEKKFPKNRSIMFKEIKQNPQLISYQVANYLCFTINSQNYNRKRNEPDWVKKIIDNIEEKRFRQRLT